MFEGLLQTAFQTLMKNPAIEKAVQDGAVHVLSMYETINRIEAKLDAVIAERENAGRKSVSGPTGSNGTLEHFPSGDS